MASAYAALVSLAHIIEQIQDDQLHPPLNHLHITNQLETLHQNITFFLDFFERSNYNTYDREFEIRIAHTAQTAEDLIESYIVDRVLNHQNGNTTIHHTIGKSIQTAMQEMDLLKKDAISASEQRDQDGTMLLGSSSPSAIAAFGEENPTVVGLDDALTSIMEKLTQQHESGRRVVTISGMGGIGKTTLARKLYENNYMVYHFYVRSWATISKNYSAKDILIEIISRLKFLEGDDDFSLMSVGEIGIKLYQYLSGRRYLVILDDMWDVEAWDEVRSFFPASNESGVVITTREQTVSSLGFFCYRMRLLDERESWDLFRRKVFRNDDEPCPHELEEIGRNISKNCKGLPLSIVVIGGHLATSPLTREYWSYIAGHLNPLVTLDDYERCLRIMSLSYVNLPVHLKPCFLYMGTFREDEKVRVSRLKRLWVAEGFLKKIQGKSPEETAEQYVRDLVGRNLISAHKPRPTGKIKYCLIHDILRDVCLKEAQETKFLCVAKDRDLESRQLAIDEKERRLVVNGRMLEEEEHRHLDESMVLHKSTLLRTLIYHGTLPSLSNFKFLRLLRSDPVREGQPEMYDVKLDFINELATLRHIEVSQLTFNPLSVPSSICFLWNLQSLIVQGSLEDSEVPPEIWKMHQLRHIKIFDLRLPDPPDDDIILKNLLSLKEVSNFKCSDEVVKRLANIKKLHICYSDNEDLTWAGLGSCNLHNLTFLDKLESFSCVLAEVKDCTSLLGDISFPSSLKKLSISQLTWEDITSKIGSLPSLEVLTLSNCFGTEWELEEGQFGRLKFLQLASCPDLECFAADNRHFQCLQRLDLVELYELREISLDVVDIETLTLMKVICCGDDAVICAKDIAETQDGNGNEEFQVKVQVRDGSELSEDELSSDSHNFQTILPSAQRHSDSKNLSPKRSKANESHT